MEAFIFQFFGSKGPSLLLAVAPKCGRVVSDFSENARVRHLLLPIFRKIRQSAVFGVPDFRKMQRSHTFELRPRTKDRGRRTEDGGLKTEDRGLRTEGRGQRTEDRGQRTEDRVQRTEDRGQRTEDGGQRTEDRVARDSALGALAPPPMMSL